MKYRATAMATAVDSVTTWVLRLSRDGHIGFLLLLVLRVYTCYKRCILVATRRVCGAAARRPRGTGGIQRYIEYTLHCMMAARTLALPAAPPPAARPGRGVRPGRGPDGWSSVCSSSRRC